MIRRRRRSPKPLTGPDAVLKPVPDDHPKDALFTQPLVVDSVRTLDPEPQDDGTTRVAFVVRVKDADGKRCPDLMVDATIVGPHRTGSGQALTDLMGQATFRMAGPAGTYRLSVDDVAAGGLAWDREASVTDATAEVPVG